MIKCRSKCESFTLDHWLDYELYKPHFELVKLFGNLKKLKRRLTENFILYRKIKLWNKISNFVFTFCFIIWLFNHIKFMSGSNDMIAKAYHKITFYEWKFYI